MFYKAGDTIGQYTIIRELGSGSFGIVYLAEWPVKQGKRQGALKILKDPKFKDILEEVSAWARVSHHPNILTFITATEHNKEILLISEYVPDGSLEEWIQAHAGKKETVESAVGLMVGVLRGLEKLHEYDIIHRDVKPANILLKGDTPLLADFGLARGLDLVQSSVLAGTWLYMSPELINAKLSQGLGAARYERTEADDLWASAATFYQMFAGELPFKTINEIMIASSPAPLPPHIPKGLRDVIEKALQKEPAPRFQTATEMREALEQAWNDFKQLADRDTLKPEDKLESERQQRAAEQEAEQQPNKLLAKDYFNRANEYYDKKDYDTAIQNYDKAIELDPQDAVAYSNRGPAYYEKGNYDQAIKDYNKAIELNPQYAIAYNRRGNAYENKGNYEQAFQDYNKAIELNPQYAHAYYNRGLAYYERGNHNQAIKDYDKSIELDPQSAHAYNNRGNAYKLKGKYDQAIKDYDKAIELDPQEGVVYNNRGAVYHLKGNYEQAIKDYNKAIELNPQYAMSYYNRGLTYERLGRTVKAAADRRKYEELEGKK